MCVVAPCGSQAASIAGAQLVLVHAWACRLAQRRHARVGQPAARRIHSISSADFTSRSRVYASFRSTSPSRAGRLDHADAAGGGLELADPADVGLGGHPLRVRHVVVEPDVEHVALAGRDHHDRLARHRPAREPADRRAGTVRPVREHVVDLGHLFLQRLVAPAHLGVVEPHRRLVAPASATGIASSPSASSCVLRFDCGRSSASVPPAVKYGFPRDHQVLGREARNDLAAVLGDHELLLDPRRRPAVARRPERLEREHHPLADLLRVVERDEPAEDRFLPDREPDAVAELERKAASSSGSETRRRAARRSTTSAVVAPGRMRSIAASR